MKTTVVTMFFNLKELRDASLQTRPVEFYVKNGVNTLKIKNPMIIFCDETTEPFLREIRDREVGETVPTVYIVKNIKEYEYYIQNWDIINENRKKSNGYKDPSDRNTVSYFLMGMFKPVALRIAKQRNDFNSTHYAWIDLGCNHIVRKLDDNVSKMLDKPNPKVSVCYIHYRGKDEITNMKSYLQYGGPCGIASTAYTVEKDYVDRYYSSMFSIFNEMLYVGYGHTDETVMVYCYDRYPEIFDIYYGDYYSIFTNYHEPIDDYNSILHFFINQAINKNRGDLAQVAINKIVKVLADKKELTSEEVYILESINQKN